MLEGEPKPHPFPISSWSERSQYHTAGDLPRLQLAQSGCEFHDCHPLPAAHQSPCPGSDSSSNSSSFIEEIPLVLLFHGMRFLGKLSSSYFVRLQPGLWLDVGGDDKDRWWAMRRGHGEPILDFKTCCGKFDTSKRCYGAGEGLVA